MGRRVIGLNDLQKIFGGASPTTVLTKLGQNMGGILCGLTTGISPSPLVIVGNLPEFPWLTEMNPQVLVVIQAANQIIAEAATSCGAKVADVYSAFDGRSGVFLHDRNGASATEPHPTNLGYRLMAEAFQDAAAD